jgi:hypothetical protein
MEHPAENRIPASLPFTQHSNINLFADSASLSGGLSAASADWKPLILEGTLMKTLSVSPST